MIEMLLHHLRRFCTDTHPSCDSGESLDSTELSKARERVGLVADLPHPQFCLSPAPKRQKIAIQLKRAP